MPQPLLIFLDMCAVAGGLAVIGCSAIAVICAWALVLGWSSAYARRGRA